MSIAPWPTLLPLGIVLVGVVSFWSIAIPVGRGLVPASQASPAETPLDEAGRPAGFWIRLAAFLIDFAAVIVLYVIYAVTALRSELVGTILGIAFLTAFIGILVASPGKRALDLQIVKPDGSRVGLLRKSCRWIVTAVTIIVDPFMIAFRKDKRGLHDLICDTVVLHRR